MIVVVDVCWGLSYDEQGLMAETAGRGRFVIVGKYEGNRIAGPFREKGTCMVVRGKEKRSEKKSVPGSDKAKSGSYEKVGIV